MDEPAVRERAEALCTALVAGDVDLAITDFSSELRQNLGEVIALLPLPSNSADIESIEHSGSGYTVVLRLVGETEEVLIQTRWKERDDHPTMIELSHLSKTPTVVEPDDDSEPAAVGHGSDTGPLAP